MIPALVKFVEEFVDKNFRVHSCEEEICENDEDAATTLDDDKEPEELVATEESPTLSIEDEQSQSEIENINPNVEIETTTTTNHNVFDIADVEFDNEESKEKKEDSNVETVDEQIREMKQFRVNSPSYQAVQVSQTLIS